uniref:MBD domain-containing protein n=1 Tax=Leersia perrieri TaxID=77586 RepID=A0A0D9X5E7_9ORYZ
MDYSNSPGSRTRSGLVRLNNTMEYNEAVISKTRSGLVRIKDTVKSEEVLLSKTRSGLTRANINVSSNEGSCSTIQNGLVRGKDIVDSNVGNLTSKTRGGLVRRNAIADSTDGSCSKTRSGLVRGNATLDSNEGSYAKTRSGLVRGGDFVGLNQDSSSKTRSGLVRGGGIVNFSEGSSSKIRSELFRENTTVTASNNSYSATRSGLVRGNITVDSKEESRLRTPSGLGGESIQMDCNESSCSRTRSGLVRRKPSMVQVKDEPMMHGLSDGCLKEDTPGKIEPNHKSNLVESKDKPVMKGPDGWWKEGRLMKHGSKKRSDLFEIRDELSIKGLPDGCSKEDLEIKDGSNHKNGVLQRKDGRLPDGWWKEDRPRKNGSNQKTDPYYIDPVSGYEFRSLKDVHRFLKTGDIYKCSMRPKKRTIQDPHTIENQSHTSPVSQHTRPGTADKAIQCELLTSEGVLLPWEEQLSPYRESNTKNKTVELEGMIAPQRYANKVDALLTASTGGAPREKKSSTRKRKEPKSEVKPKKHKIIHTKMAAMPLRASPRLASLNITHDLNNKPEDEPISVNLVNEVQTADKSRLNQAGIDIQMQTDQETAANQLRLSQADTANQSQLIQADTGNQIFTDQEIQSSHMDSFDQLQTIEECITNHSESQLSQAATVNEIQTKQGNMAGQLQSSQTESLDQIWKEQESSVSQLQSSKADSYTEIQTIQEYITDQSQLQLSHTNEIQTDLGNTVYQLQSSQADSIFQMEATQEYAANQSQSRQADIANHIQVNQDNTANQFQLGQLRQADTVNNMRTIQERTTDQPQLIQALTVNKKQANEVNTANHLQSWQADHVNHIQVNQDNTANQFQLRQADTVNRIRTMQESATDQPQLIEALTVNQIEANEENTANYLQPNYAENNILQASFSLTPEPEEAPVASFWKNAENQELPISMQTGGKPIVSSASNVECRNRNVAAAAPAQPTRASLPITSFWKNVENQELPVPMQTDGNRIVSSGLNVDCQYVPASQPTRGPLPVTSFWKNVENQGLPVFLQTDRKPAVSSAINVEYQNVPATAAIAQQTRAPQPGAASDQSRLDVPSQFGNSWSDPCIEFAFKTLTGDLNVLDDTSAVEEYFPQHDLNQPPSPDYSASPSFAPSFDNTRNFTQVDHAGLPAPNPSDKVYNGSWFPPK